MYRRMARMALVAAVASAALGYQALEKRVTVVIEGRPVAVRTFAPSVEAVLERAGIDVSPRDVIRPPLPAAIDEGERIVIRRAKPVTLVVDGASRRMTVTALRVEGVLEQAGIRLHPMDRIVPALDARVWPGSTIRYVPVDRVTIKVGRSFVKRVVTDLPRVGGVLGQAGIKLGPLDRVVPSIGQRHRGETIRVLRVRRSIEARREAIGFDTVTRKTRDLEYGVRKIARQGRPGVRTIRTQVTYVNGEATKRRHLGGSITRRPVDRLILVGTSFPGCACDRGIQTGGASWYSQADGLTAAHKTLPFGTVVRVENLDTGKWVNVVIRDRGPFIDGRIIDLSDEAFRRLAPLSQGVMRVRIRW